MDDSISVDRTYWNKILVFLFMLFSLIGSHALYVNSSLALNLYTGRCLRPNGLRLTEITKLDTQLPVANGFSVVFLFFPFTIRILLEHTQHFSFFLT